MTRPWTIAALATSLRRGQTCALELVETCLERIARHEPKVQAWVLRDDDGARQRAAQLDTDAAHGRWHGPLHGIPLGVKDIIDVAGWPTLAGSTLRTGHVATSDAPLVARLRDAGAIFLGKTVTTQFASFDPPVTRNPWNMEQTPGGSSSGSAAATALGMCVAAMGSQTGGSIIRPAAYCGACGFKPSFGLLDAEGFVPLAWHMDHPGPITSCAADLRTLLGVLRGDTAPRANDAPPLTPHTRAPRLGWLQGWFWERAEPAVRTTFEQAVERLRGAGAIVSAVSLPVEMDDVIRRHRVVMATEAAAYHRPWFPAQRNAYGPKIASLMDEGREADVLDYALAVQRQTEFRQQATAALAPFDALIMPSVTGAAPRADSTGDPSYQSPWSYAGLPAATLPCGLTDASLPVGFQLIGRFGADDLLLHTAEWCEGPLAWRGLADDLI